MVDYHEKGHRIFFLTVVYFMGIGIGGGKYIELDETILFFIFNSQLLLMTASHSTFITSCLKLVIN